ncbi:hypothetical protein [Corynebacterium durum]|uniref:hypothetical protein n=1 Tax=Corynebacterium durum TaxID=61592 RepID=UPI0026DBF92F|nr:hypothetical protein [Corynebacterium durum]MDO4653375.1 hypothetical protein [Corynebacterium durum]
MDKVTDAVWRAANKNGELTRKMQEVAERIAASATMISRREGGKANYRVETSIRPAGRAQVLVVSDDRDEEYGTEKTKRIGALRRAAKGEQ